MTLTTGSAFQRSGAARAALHALAASWQEKTSLLPDYQAAWLNFGGNDSTAAAGLIGVGLTLLLAGAVGVGCRALVRRN